MGIGAIIGTGIFVLAGIVSGLAALCYAEFASAVPISGSAYTYSYATLGELIAWIIGWDLILEYAVGAAAVSIGWSGYLGDFLNGALGINLSRTLTASPVASGIINLPPPSSSC
jgi:APA family basic amino acid/polyamine antiporter